MSDSNVKDNSCLRRNRKHVGYCEDCDWEGYFEDNDRCEQCKGKLVSVWIYDKEEMK